MIQELKQQLMEEKNLQASLKTRWFEMTKAGVKLEDYREITPYWAKRLMLYQNNEIGKELESYETEVLCKELNDSIKCLGDLHEEISFVLDNWCLSFKHFDYNIMTLGYPSKDDKDRILKLEHKGIEIRTGNELWGAELNKLYFVIKHGKIIEQ